MFLRNKSLLSEASKAWKCMDFQGWRVLCSKSLLFEAWKAGVLVVIAVAL